jgi:hypothetical protein
MTDWTFEDLAEGPLDMDGESTQLTLIKKGIK